MKSYTDIKQSKKLAEILPLESADMGWFYSRNPQAARNQMWAGTKAENADIPCWTLSALFKMLPYSARLERGSSTELCYVTLPNELESSGWHIEPVDACYEMILKLHELKKL